MQMLWPNGFTEGASGTVNGVNAVANHERVYRDQFVEQRLYAACEDTVFSKTHGARLRESTRKDH